MNPAAPPLLPAVGHWARGVDPTSEIRPASFFITAPPSANKLFKNVPKAGGRARTAAYSEWTRCVLTELHQQRVTAISGPVFVVIGVERTSKLADLDNTLKATLDVIVKACLIEDDKFVTGLTAVWLPKVDTNAKAHIKIYPAQRLALDFIPARDLATGAVLSSENPN